MQTNNTNISFKSYRDYVNLMAVGPNSITIKPKVLMKTIEKLNKKEGLNGTKYYTNRNGSLFYAVHRNKDIFLKVDHNVSQVAKQLLKFPQCGITTLGEGLGLGDKFVNGLRRIKLDK